MIPYFYPAWRYGGPVRVAYDVSRKLVERGHSVVVYTSDIQDEKTRMDTAYRKVGGVDVFYFRNLSLSAAKRNLFVTPSLILAVKNNIKSFDVVHIHGNRTTQSPILHYFLKKNSVPYVVQAHGGLSIIGGRRLKQLYDLFFGHKLLKDASKVIALTTTEAQQYRSMGVPKEKIEVIPNGIDLTEYADLPLKGCFKKKHGISEDKKIILYLGRINRIKGTDLLVEAYANLINKLKCKVARLVIVGPDDGYLREIQALIKTLKIENDVLILKPLYGRDKLEAYVDADMYVLPSRYETFPMSVLEAAACRTPVILTENCEIAGYFNEKIGLISKPDSKHLCEALLQMLLFENKQNIFRENCKATINEFNISNVISKLEDVYEEIANIHVR